MWYVLRGWSPLRGMRRTAQARALRVSAGADALCCMGWTPILPAILCLSRLRRSSVLRLWLRPRGARAERGYPTSWAHLRDKPLRFGLRLRLEQAHRLAFGSSPSCRRGSNWGSRAPLGARAPPPASTGRLGSLSPCRAHSDAGAPVPLRLPWGAASRGDCGKTDALIASQFAHPLPCPMPIFVGGRYASLQKFGMAPHMALCAAHGYG